MVSLTPTAIKTDRTTLCCVPRVCHHLQPVRSGWESFQSLFLSQAIYLHKESLPCLKQQLLPLR